jgi:hypothetical protein
MKKEKDEEHATNDMLRKEVSRLKKEAITCRTLNEKLKSAQQKIKMQMLEEKLKGANADILALGAALGSRANVVIPRVSAPAPSATVNVFGKPGKRSSQSTVQPTERRKKLQRSVLPDIDDELLVEEADIEVMEEEFGDLAWRFVNGNLGTSGSK